ncbi:uncharacterized protein [Dysidea avara]|uniref:uncharacterized protein n=1 Tax=Dysidea avara TaxID=196820 RepID=UPI003320E3E1
MLLKVTFAVLLLVVAATAATVDDNDIVDLALDNYFGIVNASGGEVGCCPVIVRGPKGSVIQPFTGWRGNVALIVDWGTCTVGDHGFICGVDWGDGSRKDVKLLDDFGPCQIAHQYEKVDAQYTVTAFYCSAPSGKCATKCCRSYVRTIDTSYDPGNPNFTL